MNDPASPRLSVSSPVSSAATPPEALESLPHPCPDTALVLSGGGARAAYQVGMLRCLSRHFPGTYFPIITGVSAGAINAAYLASHPGDLRTATEDLCELWRHLRVKDVFTTTGTSLWGNLLRWGARLVSGGGAAAPQVKSLVDTQPLRELICRELTTLDGEIQGIDENLESGRLRALALTTLNYTTGQTVTWIHTGGPCGRDITTWERPHRTSRRVRMTAEHVMASAALPLLFPAVRLPDGWHGDGGVRLSAPLSPAVHLGATKILAVSTRFYRQVPVEELPVSQYPPPAQILGKLLNAVFLDILDQDAHRLQKINRLVTQVPEDERGGMREIECLVLRPSQDLGRLAAEFEPDLPNPFRYLTRSLGTRETKSPDFLSLVMFQPEYLRRLIEIGEADAEERLDEIRRLVGGEEAEEGAAASPEIPGEATRPS